MQCNFEILVKYLDKQLNLDTRLALFDHLDHCEACFEALYQLSRDRDSSYFIYQPVQEEKAS